MYQLWSTAT